MKARLVVQEVNTGTWRDAFAGTPSLLTLRLLFWMADRSDWRIEFGDITAAFLHADLDKNMVVFVIPPATDRMAAGQTGEVWKLRKALYGLREAPRLFNEFLAKRIDAMGFARSRVEPQLYWHRSSRSWMLIHADDIALASSPQVSEELWKMLEANFKIKRTGSLGYNLSLIHI